MKQLITSKTAEITAPVRMAIGFTKQLTLERKSSKDVLGRPFSEVAARAIAQMIEADEVKSKGILYNSAARPAQGAFALLSEAAIAQMLEVLKDLGLHIFENATPVDFFIRPTVNMTQEHISPTPIECQTIFQKYSPDLVKLLFHVIVMDPMFIDEQGKNLYLQELPAQYIAAVLNVLNPMACYRAYGKEKMQELLPRAGKYAPMFEANFKAAVKKWQNTATPSDLKTLQDYLQQGLLHEFTHALALHLPDVIPADLPQTEQERLNSFSVTAYINLLGKATELFTSVVYVKNLLKALQMVEKHEASVATQNHVIRNFALEMFCDRFSMYMYETARKMQVYHEVMPGLGDISFDILRRMEKQRLSNPEAFRALNEMTSDELNDLDKKLKAVETEHVYISAFGDPAILESERSIFEPFLDLLRHFDREKNIEFITEKHTEGQFVKATKEGFISDNKLALPNIVQQTKAY